MEIVHVVIFAFAIISVSLFIYFIPKYFHLIKRFKPVLSLDAEIAKLRLEIADLQREVGAANAKGFDLNTRYGKAKEVYEQLLKETNLLEQGLDDMSYGLYKPQYKFDTAEEYKTKMMQIYEQKKNQVHNDKAVTAPTNWKVNGSKAEGVRMIKKNAKLMLRAFNGECDAAIARVDWNNVTRMEERIRKAYEAINKMGTVVSISITPSYLNISLAELQITHEYELKRQEEKEEQRAIREQMREEERAQREYEKAQRDAAIEKEKAEKALEAARIELQRASGEHLESIQERIGELEQKLADAQAKQDHAVSMAQVTKMGHVYVISNMGSFGEDVLKIGMTRRLEPAERIYELSGASVPFNFDIHAMIFSNDARELETSFHRKFSDRRLNLVNQRKEYFRVSLDEVADFASSKGVTVEFTKLAEAKQYRESEALRLKSLKIGEAPEIIANEFPESIFSIEED